MAGKPQVRPDEQAVESTAAAPSRALIAYLRSTRAEMTAASDVRRIWIRQVGRLIIDARTEQAADIARLAGESGAEQQTAFGEIRTRVAEIEPPEGCADCQSLFLAWLDRHLLACQVLEGIGRSGDVLGLRSVQRILAESRGDTLAFSAAYQTLVAPLRARAKRKKKSRIRWPFGR